MRRIHADLMLLGCAAIWGFAFLFQKSAMAHMGPFLFIACRGLVASLALAPLVYVEHRSSQGWPPKGIASAALLAGLAFFGGAALQQFGLITATVTNTGFLTALYVVITPFIAWAMMNRRPGALVWVAAALSFAGTWLLGGGSVSAFSRGDILVAICAFFWAIHVVILGKASGLGRPVLLTALQFVVVSLLAWAAAFTFETVSLSAIETAAIDIAFVGIMSSAVTFTIFTVALRYTSPSEATIIVSMETVFAAFGAYIFRNEWLTALGFVGAALILVANLIVQLRGSGTQEPPRQSEKA